jgi:ABC-type branched-subunit amino acid transport system substrate-binding protein
MKLTYKNIVASLLLAYVTASHTQTQELIVGSTLDLSKTLKIESEHTLEGLHRAFDKINREGGVKNKRIKLVILDDEYDPQKARKNVENLIQKHNVEFIVSPMGAVPVSGFLDLVKDKKIVVAFPSSGSPALRDPQLTYMIHFRPSYTDTDISLLRYAQETLKAKKFAFFYPTDESAEGTEEHIRLSGIPKDNYILVTYHPASTSFKKQVEDIIKFNPDAIALFGTSRAATELIRQLGIQNLVKKWLLGVEQGDELFRAFLKEQGLTKQFIDTQNLPNPQTSNLEIVREYRKEMGTKPLNVFSLEAYISGTLFAEIVKRIEGDITKENFIKAAEAIKDVDFKGLKLNFDPTTRQLSSQIWLDTGEKDWIPINVQELKKAALQASTQEQGKIEQKKDEIPLEKKDTTPFPLGIKR